MTHFEEVHASLRLGPKFLFERITNINYFFVKTGGQVMKLFTKNDEDENSLHSSIHSYVSFMGIKLPMAMEFEFIGPCQVLGQTKVFGRIFKASINLIPLSMFKSRLIIPIYSEKNLFNQFISFVFAAMLTLAVIL